MIVERIKEYLDSKGIKIATFEKSVGMSNASFGKSLKNGGTIGSDKLEIILSVYPDINPEWLLTGKGEMIRSLNNEVKDGMGITSHVFRSILADKDAIIVEKSEEIGRLKQRVEDLEQQRGKDASDAADTIAHAG